MSTWMMSPSPTTASLKIRRFNSSMVLPSVQCTVSMLLNKIINYFTRPCNIDKRTKIGYSNQYGDCGFVTLPAHSQLQRYRSGRNELDSKSSCPQGHVGSNPTASATNPLSLNGFKGFLFCVLLRLRAQFCEMVPVVPNLWCPPDE